MSFLNQFSTYFDSQERLSELYALWSAIGVNMEKAFLEEQNKINAEFTDINNFSEDTMRSWLAFFLQKIPYRTSATSQVTVSLKGNSKITRIPKYDQLSTDDGVIYTLYEDISLIPGDVRTVTAVQGKRITESGRYNSIIKIQTNNPDLNYIEVYLNGKEIPAVSYETSYDQLLYIGNWKPQSNDGNEWGGSPFLQNAFGKKGEFYNVIADGYTKFSEEGITTEFKKGDLVVYDGETWQRSAYTNKLQPIQFTNSYAVPRNGYFAYYYNNYLYIKIFAGSEITDPNGQDYVVNYIQSDGIQGQIDANTLSFVSSYEDVDENPVEIEVSNTASSAAVNEPSVGKLGLYLKQRLYSSINVSSVPEYTHWFNAQPEVGDCLVLSDYEKFLRSGKTEFTPTGIVDVFLVGIDGNPLSEEVKQELLERIEPFKDVAVLQISEFEEIYQYLVFEYTTSTNENAFEQFIQSTATQYYNLNYLQSKNSSLFDELDLAAIVEDIQQNSPYNSTGLILKGYHYKEISNVNVKKLTFESYLNERPGTGWYELITDPGTEDEHMYRLEEIESAGTTTSCMIFGEKNVATAIGTHTDNVVSIDLSEYDFDKAILKCYWGMANEGILSIGVENGLRKLAGVSVNKVRTNE